MNFDANFTNDEIRLFEETQILLADDRLFFAETVDPHNRGIVIISLLYIFFGCASIVIGNLFFNKFTEWFFIPVGIVFLSVGCAARNSFAKITKKRRQRLDKIIRMNLCDKSLIYYRQKLFYKYFNTKTRFSYILEFFLVVSAGQTFSWIAKTYYDHDVSVVIWSLLVAMYLNYMSEIKLLFIPSEENQLNRIIRLISKEQKRQQKDLHE